MVMMTMMMVILDGDDNNDDGEQLSVEEQSIAIAALREAFN